MSPPCLAITHMRYLSPFLAKPLYKKINVAHLDEIKALNEKLEKTDALIALLEARINVLEAK